MSSSNNSLVQRVQDAVNKIAPLQYAEKEWDNVGTLVQSPSCRGNAVILTNDVTDQVVDEAIQKNAGVILSYHPIIFRGMKSMNCESAAPKERQVVRCLTNGISVFCPHSALDATPVVEFNINEWLLRSALGESTLIDSKAGGKLNQLRPSDIIDLKTDTSSGVKYGCGRFIALQSQNDNCGSTLSLTKVISNLLQNLELEHLQSTATSSVEEQDKIFKGIAVCVGSGSGVFSKLRCDQVNLLITGEMSHHEILSYKEKGVDVILLGHDNSERGYLKVLQQYLQRELSGVDVIVSQSDKSLLTVHSISNIGKTNNK